MQYCRTSDDSVEMSYSTGLFTMGSFNAKLNFDQCYPAIGYLYMSPSTIAPLYSLQTQVLENVVDLKVESNP
jgi:hypothetical protein